MKYGIGIIILTLFVSTVAQSGNIANVPHNFTSGTPARASDVNDNFEALREQTDDNANRIAATFSGNGSAGDLTVSGPIDWAASNNLNFRNVLIEAGQTFIVPAGTVIKCSGNFVNNGSIFVGFQQNAGNLFFASEHGRMKNRLPGRGDSSRAAGQPEAATASDLILTGAAYGFGINKIVAASSFNQLRLGGGGGSGAHNSAGGGGEGGNGGGVVKIYCAGSITNNGTISAFGENAEAGAGGGGGGGIVVLASMTSVTNDLGTIDVKGGNGATADSNSGIGGGGGGGIVVMVAPSISNTGNTYVTGGTTASTPILGSVDELVHSAGGAGGASGGNGGRGGNISNLNIALPGTAGDDGYVIEIKDNPVYHMN